MAANQHTAPHVFRPTPSTNHHRNIAFVRCDLCGSLGMHAVHISPEQAERNATESAGRQAAADAMGEHRPVTLRWEGMRAFDEAERSARIFWERLPVPARPEPDVDAMRTAIEQGKAAAIRTTRPGATFRGASPEAIAAGHQPDTVAHRLFLSAFIDQIDEQGGGVRTDERGMVLPDNSPDAVAARIDATPDTPRASVIVRVRITGRTATDLRLVPSRDAAGALVWTNTQTGTRWSRISRQLDWLRDGGHEVLDVTGHGAFPFGEPQPIVAVLDAITELDAFLNPSHMPDSARPTFEQAHDALNAGLALWLDGRLFQCRNRGRWFIDGVHIDHDTFAHELAKSTR